MAPNFDHQTGRIVSRCCPCPQPNRPSTPSFSTRILVVVAGLLRETLTTLRYPLACLVVHFVPFGARWSLPRVLGTRRRPAARDPRGARRSSWWPPRAISKWLTCGARLASCWSHLHRARGKGRRSTTLRPLSRAAVGDGQHLLPPPAEPRLLPEGVKAANASKGINAHVLRAAG